MKQIIDVAQYPKIAGTEVISGDWTFRSSTPDAGALTADVITSGLTSTIQTWKVNGTIVAQMQQVFGFVPGIVAPTGGLFFFGEANNYILVNGALGINDLRAANAWQVAGGNFWVQAGSAAAPGFAFAAETSTGTRHVGTGNQALVCSGADQLDINTTRTRVLKSLYIGSNTAFDHQISGTPTANRALTLPDKAGSIQVKATELSPNHSTHWAKSNLAASATNASMGPVNFADADVRHYLPAGAKLVSMNWTITEAVTAGQITVHIYKNGTKQTAGTYDVNITSASGTGGYAKYTGNEISYAEGDYFQFKYTTNSAFTPTGTLDLITTAFFSFD